MLAEMATVGDGSVVSWQPHGKAFRVHQPEVFARTVMPRYFKQQTKYKSFQRQLHMYGFHRIATGMDTGAYFHSMFIRHKKSMSLLMSCEKIKGKNKKSRKVIAHHADSYPDFYNLETTVAKDLPNPARTTATNEKKRGYSKHGPEKVFTTGSGDNHTHKNVEMPHLNIRVLPFNHEVKRDRSPSHQLSDWLEQAGLQFSVEEEQEASPYHGYGCSASGKGKSVSTLLPGASQQKNYDDGVFEGKRFFYVSQTKAPNYESSLHGCQ
jgi:hypothetical protein